jgi:endonuclease/exonuclease/phosphatase family metal-dependent hydrolase
MRVRHRAALVATAILCGAAVGCTKSAETSGPAAAEAQVRVVSQNILHGIACAPETDRCELPARVELFARQLDAARCPEVVGLQEANEAVVAALRTELPRICDRDYELVTDADPGIDREVVLTTGRVIGTRRVHLAGPLRTAFLLRVATDVGLVDFISTHLASSSDDRPCDEATCPPPCQTTEMLNACQARQVVEFAEEVTEPAAVTVIAGDLNARVDEQANEVLRQAGFADTHLLAGNTECNPATGAECTSGRVDDDLSDLTDPTSHQTERIDFVYLGGARDCGVDDPTGLFNPEPASEGPGALAFPSDHTGVEATLVCTTTARDLEAATSAVMPPEVTTTTVVGPVDASTEAAITTAFTDLFGGEVTNVDQKLASLEDGEALREAFLQSYEATKAVASQISVRIDAITLVDPSHADVTYTLLLDGTPVLDHLAGRAVLANGRWLVSRRTYCEVSTQGATEIPEPCR